MTRLSWPAAWAWGLAGLSWHGDDDDDDLGHSHCGTTHLRGPHTRYREEKHNYKPGLILVSAPGPLGL